MSDVRADHRPAYAPIVRRAAHLGRWLSRPFRALPAPRRQRWYGLGLCAVLLTSAALWFADGFARDQAHREIHRSADVAAQLHAAVLRGELERHRSLPFVLGEDADVRTALAHQSAGRLAAMNRKLETLKTRTNAGVIYLLNTSGVAIASSNWEAPDSFVGTDYAFRPYFMNAMHDGVAEYFSLGALSRKPGLFLARRVDDANGAALGVVVVKVEFDELEAEWRRSGEPAYVVDGNGVVLVTNIASWRFGMLAPSTPERHEEIAQSLQMSPSLLRPLDFARSGEFIVARLPDAPQARTFVESRVPTEVPGWTLHLLQATDPLLSSSVTAARTLTLLTALLATLAGAFILYRLDRSAARAMMQRAAQLELERRVDARTSELRAANDRLVIEMDERRRTEADLHLLQDELVQANKLAVLGQIAAGVAHEINQPVAAIRTYADNAGVLLTRQQPERVKKNLDLISGMTQRIGEITGELRAFARKTRAVVQPIEIEPAIAGALLLVGPRARQRRVQLARSGATANLRAMGDRTRLEQVLVNLLQNAVEALADTHSPQIQVHVERLADRVLITVSDNGPGIAPDVRDNLFKPFVTDKEDGLGLGLIISRDIVTALGGELLVGDATPHGAVFTISLRRA